MDLATPDNDAFQTALRVLATNAVLALCTDAVDLGHGPAERAQTFDIMAALWRQAELEAKVQPGLPDYMERPEMVWAGMSRFLGSMLRTSGDLLDHKAAEDTYTNLLIELRR